MENYDANEKRTKQYLILIFIVFAIGIGIGGELYYRNYETQYRTDIEKTLTSISE
jgi:hypothetical protein